MMTRRRLLQRSLFAALTIAFFPNLILSKSSAKNEGEHAFQWHVPEAHFETVKKELQFEGEVAADKDAKGVMMFIFAGAVLLPSLAKAVLALRREMIHGGVVIDIRGEKIDMQTDKSLPGGVIIVITAKGTDFYETNEIGSIADLVTALRK